VNNNCIGGKKKEKKKKNQTRILVAENLNRTAELKIGRREKGY